MAKKVTPTGRNVPSARFWGDFIGGARGDQLPVITGIASTDESIEGLTVAPHSALSAVRIRNWKDRYSINRRLAVSTFRKHHPVDDADLIRINRLDEIVDFSFAALIAGDPDPLLAASSISTTPLTRNS